MLLFVSDAVDARRAHRCGKKAAAEGAGIRSCRTDAARSHGGKGRCPARNEAAGVPTRLGAAWTPTAEPLANLSLDHPNNPIPMTICIARSPRRRPKREPSATSPPQPATTVL